MADNIEKGGKPSTIVIWLIIAVVLLIAGILNLVLSE
jgi:adenosylcobinamide amidohydrolase